jgi:(p)ppGpp synthase/HD superfamily hydrolase
MSKKLYEKALKIATEYHKGQKRNKSGLDYITHPVAVASKFSIDKIKAVAVLHDIVEDTDLTIEELEALGFDEEVISAVDLLTKRKGQDYVEYLTKIRKDDYIACLVKIEDIKHNLSDLENGNMKDKYLLALNFLNNEMYK